MKELPHFSSSIINFQQCEEPDDETPVPVRGSGSKIRKSEPELRSNSSRQSTRGIVESPMMQSKSQFRKCFMYQPSSILRRNETINDKHRRELKKKSIDIKNRMGLAQNPEDLIDGMSGFLQEVGYS